MARARLEAGADELNVVVVDLDLREQDIMSINMNMIRELMPDKFGSLEISLKEKILLLHLNSQLIAMEQSEMRHTGLRKRLRADYSHGEFTRQFITYKFRFRQMIRTTLKNALIISGRSSQ